MFYYIMLAYGKVMSTSDWIGTGGCRVGIHAPTSKHDWTSVYNWDADYKGNNRNEVRATI